MVNGGWGRGNAPAAFAAGQAVGSIPYGAASASAIYQQGIMEGKNTCGIDYIAQSNVSMANEMRQGFANVNAQFTNILDREYQKLLMENTTLKNSNSVASAVSPINIQLQRANDQISCLRDSQGPSFFYSKNICGGCGSNSTTIPG